MVHSGVRQRSCLSPGMFNLFINAFVIQLRELDVGCHLGTEFVGCLMYADDIFLLSPSIVGLQSMLGKCFDVVCDLSLQFNVHKCHIIAFGKKYNCQLTSVFLGTSTIDWCKIFGSLLT